MPNPFSTDAEGLKLWLNNLTRTLSPILSTIQFKDADIAPYQQRGKDIDKAIQKRDQRRGAKEELEAKLGQAEIEEQEAIKELETLRQEIVKEIEPLIVRLNENKRNLTFSQYEALGLDLSAADTAPFQSIKIDSFYALTSDARKLPSKEVGNVSTYALQSGQSIRLCWQVVGRDLIIHLLKQSGPEGGDVPTVSDAKSADCWPDPDPLTTTETIYTLNASSQSSAVVRETKQIKIILMESSATTPEPPNVVASIQLPPSREVADKGSGVRP